MVSCREARSEIEEAFVPFRRAGLSASRRRAARPRACASSAKLPAFLCRDLLVAWSYRLSFVSDWSRSPLQAVMFYFVGLMVDPSVLPTYGGSRVTYMEFAASGSR